MHRTKTCCGACRYYSEYEGVCCNGDSEYRANFRDMMDTCDSWEGKDMEYKRHLTKIQQQIKVSKVDAAAMKNIPESAKFQMAHKAYQVKRKAASDVSGDKHNE